MKKRGINLMRFLRAVLIAILLAGACLPQGMAQESPKIVRVGYYEDNNGFQMGGREGERRDGYAYEYYQKIAGIAGWKYEYVYGPWSDIFEMLESGEIDIMAGVSRTEEREKLFLYPNNPMGSEAYYLFVPDGCEDIRVNEPRTLVGKTIGVNANSLMEQQFRAFVKERDINCEIKLYPGHFESRQALENGEIDGYVITDNYVLNGVKPVIKIGGSDIYFALAKGRKDLLSDINRAQEEILSDTPYYVNYLTRKYYDRSVIRAGLSVQEREWLAQKDSLRVGYLSGILPYTPKADGETPTLLNALTENIGGCLEKDITQVGYDDIEVLLKALYSGEVDAIFPVYDDLWEAEKAGLIITDGIVSDRVVAIYRDSYTSDLLNSVAVPQNDRIHQSFVGQFLPDAEIHYYKDLAECMLALANGKVRSVLQTNNLWLRYQSENKVSSVFHDTDLDQSVTLCMAVSNENPMLASILNHALLQIDAAVISDAVNQSLYATPKYTFGEFWTYNMPMVTAILLAILLIFTVWFIYYRVKMGRQQRLLARSNRYLEDQVMTTGALGQIYFCGYLLNLKTRATQKIHPSDDFDAVLYEILARTDQVDEALAERVDAAYVEPMHRFMDWRTLDARMEKKRAGAHIEMEYLDKTYGWCRAFIIAVRFDSCDVLSQVIFAVQDIDTEKREHLKNLEQKELAEYTANHDSLTGALNRNGLEAVLKRPEVLHEPLGMIYLDVDYFKEINDSHGHAQGDRVLEVLKSTLESTFRSTDYIIRLGGDEFLVLLVNCKRFSWEKLTNSLEGLHREMAAMLQIDMPISVSAGFYVSEQGYIPEMKQLADEALYRTKQGGRAGCVWVDDNHRVLQAWHDPSIHWE